ncbi:GFA family protein [Kordiimonas gwangyangensis]|uniref:GFA family protein n=1 Tax=Kordiimonas gwangyangensis TaxID=288022 RepID=UPI003F6FA9B0
MNKDPITLGGCLCGQVRFEIKGLLRDVVNCHCSMCQKLHGSMGAHTKPRRPISPSPAMRGWRGTSRPTWPGAVSAKTAAPACSGNLRPGRHRHPRRQS